MKAVRSVIGVLLGYALFAVAAVLFFRLLNQNPHHVAPVWLMACSTVYGVVFAALGARVASWVAGYNTSGHCAAVGGIIALGAAASLISTLGHGSIWSQVTALLFMAPSAVFAGRHGNHSVAVIT